VPRADESSRESRCLRFSRPGRLARNFQGLWEFSLGSTALTRAGRTSDNQDMVEAGFGIDTSSEDESVEALGGRVVAEAAKDTVWTVDQAKAAKKARFRVYLGYAPGVGKTYAMLSEGQRGRARGRDIVVGYVETYGRPQTIKMLEGLEIMPRKRLEYRGTWFEEMDVDAIIARKPTVVLVDELAHTNIPGSRRAKRWEDVVDLLTEGIPVITTVNIQHLESLNDVIANVTGTRQKETVPDWLLDLADDIELVDSSPHALRRRMSHGNIYPDPHKADLALRRFFTAENLTALRELALMRIANRVDAELISRWSKGAVPETRERILACVGRPDDAETIVRRGARMAQRAQGDLFVLHVRTGDESKGSDWLADIERLVRDLGGDFQIVDADSAVDGVLSFAYRNHITQIVVGEPLRPRWQEIVGGSFVNKLIRKAAKIDVHVIARKEQ
jgi:two-component system sensor histidine kinase KdpD